jgi:WD40 repeat protein
LVASGDASGLVWLWNVANPAHPQALGGPLINTSRIYSVAFSPNSRWLTIFNGWGYEFG